MGTFINADITMRFDLCVTMGCGQGGECAKLALGARAT